MDAEALKVLLQFGRDLGFPAAVAFFVLWRLEGAIKDNTREIHSLRVELAAHSGRQPPEK